MATAPCGVEAPGKATTGSGGCGFCWQDFDDLLDGLALETLALRACQLDMMPASVARHTSLRRLAVRGCCLADLPPGPYLVCLQHLDLRDNLFDKVPPAALAAPQLETLAMLGAC